MKWNILFLNFLGGQIITNPNFINYKHYGYKEIYFKNPGNLKLTTSIPFIFWRQSSENDQFHLKVILWFQNGVIVSNF